MSTLGKDFQDKSFSGWRPSLSAIASSPTSWCWDIKLTACDENGRNICRANWLWILRYLEDVKLYTHVFYVCPNHWCWKPKELDFCGWWVRDQLWQVVWRWRGGSVHRQLPTKVALAQSISFNFMYIMWLWEVGNIFQLDLMLSCSRNFEGWPVTVYISILQWHWVTRQCTQFFKW